MLKRRLNILQTCFSSSWGGLEIQALDESLLLGENGYSIALACIKNSRLHEEANKKGLSVLPLRVSGYVHPSAIWKLRRHLHQNRIDMVHAQLSKDIAVVSPALMLTRRRVPLVLSRRMGSGISKKDYLHKLTYSQVTKVLAISSVIHRNVAHTTPVTPDQIVTVHHGIDTEAFSPTRIDRMKVRREFGIGDETAVLGFVGRFSPGKGHEEFLLAASTLSTEFPGIHLLVVGEASRGEEQYEMEIKNQAIALGLGKITTFTGFRSDIPAVMGAFDIFVFPSYAEAFGAVLVEAMAMELPVVASQSDGVLDIVVDGETGILVPPRDSSGLAEAIRRILRNPESMRRMGVAGRKRVLECFDRRILLKKLEEVYASLIF